MARRDQEECSPAAAGEMLLVWQEPTDRALAGWCPFPGLDLSRFPGNRLQDWLADMCRVTQAERVSRESVASGHEAGDMPMPGSAATRVT